MNKEEREERRRERGKRRQREDRLRGPLRLEPSGVRRTRPTAICGAAMMGLLLDNPKDLSNPGI